MSNEERDIGSAFTESYFGAKQLAWAARDLCYSLRIVFEHEDSCRAARVLTSHENDIYVLYHDDDHWSGLHQKSEHRSLKEAQSIETPAHNTRSKKPLIDPTKKRQSTLSFASKQPLGPHPSSNKSQSNNVSRTSVHSNTVPMSMHLEEARSL